MKKQFLDKAGLVVFKEKIDSILETKASSSHSHEGLLSDSEYKVIKDMGTEGIVKTLYATETTLTFTSERITETSMIDIMVDHFGIAPKSVVSTDGSVTITFDPMNFDLKVKITICNAKYEMIGVDSFPATAKPSDIASNKTAYIRGEKITGTMSVSNGGSVNPTTSDKIFITPNTKLEGNYVVKGSDRLIANNIKKGVSIFGITGTLDNVINDIEIDGVSLPPSDPRLDNGVLNITANYTVKNIAKASLPYNSYYSAAVVYNGEIHYFGSQYTNYQQSHIKYNPITNTWSTVSTLPYKFVRGKAVVYKGEIHILGSWADNVSAYSHYKWDGENWISVSTLPYAFGSSAAFVLNGFIHIMGGTSTGVDAHYKWDGENWVKSVDLAYEFNYGGYLVYNDELHLIGGWNTGTTTNHYAFDSHTREWKEVSILPYRFNTITALTFGNEIHILGSGTGSEDEGTNHYKWDGKSWSSVGTLPFKLINGCAVTLNNELHIMGSSYDGSRDLHYVVETVKYTIDS